MRVVFAYFLLFFYTITSVGATVYMHQCQGNSLISIENKHTDINHSCPLCLPNDAETKTPTADCHPQQEGCCNTLVFHLDYKKNDTKQLIGTSSLISIAPPVTTLYRLLVNTSKITDSYPKQYGNSPKLLASSKAPLYLACCNFRI